MALSRGRFLRRGREPLTPADFGRAFVASAALLVVDASTRAFGVARTSRGLAELAHRLPTARGAGTPEDLELRTFSMVVTLRRAARALVWGGDCLPRALVLWTWLRCAGEDPSLELGVRRDGEVLTGHAWVSWRGRAVGEPNDVDSSYVTFSNALQVTRPNERRVGS